MSTYNLENKSGGKNTCHIQESLKMVGHIMIIAFISKFLMGK